MRTIRFRAGTARALLATTATLAMLLAACSDDSPTEPSPTPALDLSAAPSPITVHAGQSGTATLTLTRGGSYAGDVALSADGVPEGVAATFVPATLTGETNQSTLTLTASAEAAAAGPVNVVLRARGTGVDDATFTLPLTVSVAPALGLSGGASSLVVARGGVATTLPLTVARPAGFAGPVALAVSAPAGVTAEVTPDTLGGDQTAATLSVRAAADAAAGEIAVTAIGSGVDGATLKVPYTVTASAGSYTVAVAPSAVTVVREAESAVSATVTLARTNFPGAIRLVASEVPDGVTLSMPTGPLRGGSTAMSVKAAASAAPGEYRVTLTGTADGLEPVTTSFVLRVLEGGATFNIGMGRLPPGSPIVMVAGTELGEWSRPTIEIERTCSECDVELEASGMPAGITMVFAPSGGDRASNPAVLTRYNGWAEPRVTVAAGVPDGDYPITLTATAGEFPPVSTTLTIRVVSAGYSLAVTPGTIVVVAGGGPVSGTLRALPTADFNNYIDVSMSGAPAGLTITTDGTLYPEPGTPDFFTVQSAAGVPPGDYPIAVRGVASRTTTGTDGAPGYPGAQATATVVVRVVSPTDDRGSVPAEFVGDWQAGTVSRLQFWESHTGDYVGRNGYLAFYTFERDGTYKLLVYTLQRCTSGGTTEIWAEYSGAVTFGDGTFETRPASGHYKVEDSCFGNFYERIASSEELEQNSTTMYWAWERNDTDGKTYLRIGFDRESHEFWNWFQRYDNP
jgi:hypothetical protein